ncbi:MAG: hypothetical protein MUO72_08990 [Bacteroidales bacterium]|nr:hypothetical protein [Bacteroidales bacterium]
MKKFFVLMMLGFIMLNISTPIKAQEEKDYKFAIKTNPLAALGGPFWLIVVPLTGEYKAIFEIAVAKKSSIQVGVGYIGPSVLLNLDDLTGDGGVITGLKTSGLRIQGMYKQYISRDLNAPEGFYIGPHVSYARATIKSKDDEANKVEPVKLNINAIIGYQLITSGGFTLDIYTGMGFVSRKWNISGTDFDETNFKDRASVAIPFGVSFGYAF